VLTLSLSVERTGEEGKRIREALPRLHFVAGRPTRTLESTEIGDIIVKRGGLAANSQSEYPPDWMKLVL
jgi:hypothetical protein